MLCIMIAENISVIDLSESVERQTANCRLYSIISFPFLLNGHAYYKVYMEELYLLNQT